MVFGRPGRQNAVKQYQCADRANPQDSVIDNLGEKSPLTNRKSATGASFIKATHKRMARMLGYTLTLGSSDAWSDFATIAMVRLSIEERAALGWAALRSMDTPRHAEMVAESVLSIAGAPLPYLVSPMADARWWAADATQAELKAYALAAYEALPPSEQMAFRRHITEMEIAA